MKRLVLVVAMITSLAAQWSFGQEIQDFFQKSDTKVYWLGIDFSHVKMLGDFNQFAEWGNVTPREIRNDYFPDWNDLVYKETKKYDVATMLHQPDIIFLTDPIYRLNKLTPLDEMETRTEPEYGLEEIKTFVKAYKYDKKGLGAVLIAESLNKFKATGKYHFVVINMESNEILLHERFTTEAGGFGVKNYWAKTIFNTFKTIKDQSYLNWKNEFSK